MRKRRQVKLLQVHNDLWQRMHGPIHRQAGCLGSVFAGYIRYYGVPMSGALIFVSRKEVCRIWLKVLRRRGPKHNLPWERMQRLIDRWILLARVWHPYPLKRLDVIT